MGDISISKWLSCLHPDDRTQATESIEQAQSSGTYWDELQVHLTDNSVKWVELVGAVEFSDGELVNLIFEMPYCRTQNVTERDIARRETASRYLKELVKIRVLTERVVGREKLFIHPKLLALLTSDSNDWQSYA